MVPKDEEIADLSFADLFRTALDDFFEDTSVDDALKELDLAKIDERIPNLSVTLMPHQIIGVAWMVKQEKKTSCAGGVLADAMGLGKTIQTIATMVRNPSTDRKIRNTLIILPLPLLQQWKEEIELKSNLSVLIYHGPKRTKSINQLKAVDVVLTTYSIVGNEASGMIEPPKRRKKTDDFVDDDEEDEKPRLKQKGLLFKVHWYRCVLDEAAIIRNKSTKSHKACMLLNADIKWCLSVSRTADVKAYADYREHWSTTISPTLSPTCASSASSAGKTSGSGSTLSRTANPVLPQSGSKRF